MFPSGYIMTKPIQNKFSRALKRLKNFLDAIKNKSAYKIALELELLGTRAVTWGNVSNFVLLKPKMVERSTS